MPELIIWLAIFAISLAVLVKASDFFIDAAEKISLSFGLPPFIIGVTVVALGTSLPELAACILAVYREHSEIVVSNVIGSNIANVFFVLGITAIVGKRMHLNFDMSVIDVGFFFGSALLLGVFIWDSQFSRFEAIIFLMGMIAFVFYTMSREHEQNEDPDNPTDRLPLAWHTFLILAASVVAIYFSAEYNIKSIIKLADLLGLGSEVITLSAVALGTSLPELFVCISAVKKQQGEMAVGNILGSNIFNILAVMSIPSFFGPLIIPPTITEFALPVMIVATFLYFFIVKDQKIRWWEGSVLLFFYAAFLTKLYY